MKDAAVNMELRGFAEPTGDCVQRGVSFVNQMEDGVPVWVALCQAMKFVTGSTMTVMDLQTTDVSAWTVSSWHAGPTRVSARWAPRPVPTEDGMPVLAKSLHPLNYVITRTTTAMDSLTKISTTSGNHPVILHAN